MADAPLTPWRCFHCDEVFTTTESAIEHFGRTERQNPACQIDIAEYRAMEQRMLAYTQEDADIHREMHARLSDHQLALVREEERGYARGLEDAKKHPEELGLMLIPAAPPSPPVAAPAEPFQARVQPWMLACFGEVIAADREERNHRFLEEALELVQSCGCSASEAHQLVDYVYGRPVGEPAQEVGGVMVTLAALCLANRMDMHLAAEIELARIWTKVEKIRAKQAAKPKHSPLPEAPQPPRPGTAPLSADLTEAAQQHAGKYADDDRQDITTDVFNAFAAGAKWAVGHPTTPTPKD